MVALSHDCKVKGRLDFGKPCRRVRCEENVADVVTERATAPVDVIGSDDEDDVATKLLSHDTHRGGVEQLRGHVSTYLHQCIENGI